MTGSSDRKVTVAGLGDIHVSETTGHMFHELFAEISECADALALCGDLTNLGTVREAELLAEDLAACKIPVVAVLGNHDYECGRPDEVMRILRAAGVHFLEDHAVELIGVGFAGAKGFAGGFDNRMLSAFGEDAIKHFVEHAVAEAMKLEHALTSLTCDRKVVVLHYAPIAATVEGEPREIYPFLGSSRLAETIDHFEVAAILHGHAHHGTYSGRTRGGIPVYNCAQFLHKDSGRPYALIEI